MFSRGLYQSIAVRLDQRRSRVLILSSSIGIVVLCVFCIMDTCLSYAILFTFLMILVTTLWIESNDKKEKESLPTKQREMECPDEDGTQGEPEDQRDLRMDNVLIVLSSFVIVALVVLYLLDLFTQYLTLLNFLLIFGTPLWLKSNYNKICRRNMAAAEEGMKHLRNMFEELEQFLKMIEFDKDFQEELSTACPNYMTVLMTAKRDLLRSDCGIVITGVTSAGKTTLVNLIIEKQKLFVSSNIASTGTVCRIRNSETLELKVFSKDEVLRKEVKVDDVQKLKSIIKRFTDISHLQDEIPDAYYVDVYLPVPILKGNVIIVDTPGIGETDNLDKILMEYLPHAVSFVFVINARDAGGIHEGRLLKILTTIHENRDKMPCFDPRDVMFLTNQWDIVENDSDQDDKETGQEKTWKNIKYKLEKEWPSITPNNLFRVSLKQVAEQKKTTEFTTEYERFQKVLEETIDKNQNKRIKFYYSFFNQFTRNAERAALVRLKLIERSKDEQKEIVIRNREKITSLTNECSKGKISLIRYKTEMVSRLADKLGSYLLSSNGKNEILNPPGYENISSVSCRSLDDEVPRRVERGIRRWCEGHDVKLMIEEADGKIRSLINDIEVKFQTIEADLIGINLRNRDDVSGQAILGLRLLGLLPYSVFFGIHFGVVMTPIVAVWAFLFAGEVQANKVNDLYNNCLGYLNQQALVTRFEHSFGMEYNKLIVRIFDEALPKKLSSLEKTNEKLLADHKEIMQKRQSFECLKPKMESIRKETDLFRQKFARLFDN